MLQHLKKRLILLCGITTSSILTIIVCFMFFITLQQSEQHSLKLFEQNIDTIIDKIKDTNTIKQNWLSQMEAENQLIIYLEDQGHQLTFNGTAQTAADREVLIESIKSKAQVEGINLELNPVSSTIVSSSIFNLKGIGGQYYRGTAIVIPLTQGWRSMILLQSFPNKVLDIVKQVLLFLFLDLIGCSMLFLISSTFIGKAIKPVEENNQRQVEFIAAASHELRSPLTVILASISSIRDDMTKTKTYIPCIEGECKRMTRLISDMLLLASSDAKTWTLKKEVLDMDTFLIEEYDVLCPFTSANQQTLSLELPENTLFKVYGDKERLKQIITILVDNATNYTPKGQGIALKAYNHKNLVVIEVIDHGIGISQEQKKMIFDRFYRVDKARTDKKHFGLGLSIAQELVDLHQGKLYVKDTEGGGATFVIELEQYKK